MIFERGYFNSDKVEKSFINESLQEVKNFSASSAYDYKPTVFLSHKHSDLEDLQGVIGMLQELGAKIYIDSMDNRMPEKTSGETANRIKSVIKYCKKFILLATDSAIESYWCNWELGIGDTFRFKNHIAIIPLKEKGTYDHKYKGNEYLQIYPNVIYHNAFTNRKGHYFKTGYYIQNPYDNYIIELREWLKQ